MIDSDGMQSRASALKSPYVAKSDDPREGMRVKSLQLLCFKLANHKEKLIQMLEKYYKYDAEGSITTQIPLDIFKT